MCNMSATAMDSQEEKRIVGNHEEDENSKDDDDFSLSIPTLDTDTLMCVAVKLMVSIVASSTIATIAFMLKNARGYVENILCNFYVAVILLSIAMISLIFFNFMWNGILKDKPEIAQTYFGMGMIVSVLLVFTGSIYSCTSYDDHQVMLFVSVFIGVFISMAMLMFHDMKVQKDEDRRKRISFTHDTFGEPKSLEVPITVGEEPESKRMP